jgi:hypothetical protein
VNAALFSRATRRAQAHNSVLVVVNMDIAEVAMGTARAVIAILGPARNRIHCACVMIDGSSIVLISVRLAVLAP